MNMREKIIHFLKLSGIYFILYVFATAAFIGMFHTPFFQRMDVLMYKGTLFIFLTGVLAAILMIGCMRWMPGIGITCKDVLLLFCGFCCINMVIFTLIPVTVERSVSVFMLSYMDENDNHNYTQQDMEEIFVDKYVRDYGAFEKRFHEQIVTGSITENSDGTYRISKRGKLIVNLFRMIAKWFHTDERLVYPNEN